MVLSTLKTHNPLVPNETGKKVRGDTITLKEKERESRGGELFGISRSGTLTLRLEIFCQKISELLRLRTMKCYHIVGKCSFSLF